jgi:hypothetical protein
MMRNNSLNAWHVLVLLFYRIGQVVANDGEILDSICISSTGKYSVKVNLFAGELGKQDERKVRQ